MTHSRLDNLTDELGFGFSSNQRFVGWAKKWNGKNWTSILWF